MSRRILFYINAVNGGGAERVMLQLAGHFAKQGYKCHLLTSFTDGRFEYQIPEKVHRYSIESEETRDFTVKRNIRRIKALREHCRQYRPDVLISFMAEPNLRAVIAAIGLKVKTIVSVRNDPVKEYPGIRRYIAAWLLPMADGCVFQTEQARSWFPKKLQKKSKVITNEVSMEFFHIKRNACPENIIAVGRLYEQKNYKLLIQSFSMIAPDYPKEQLLIYGEGRLRRELEWMIEKQNLNGRVVLMGQTDNIASVLSKAKIYVLSSDYEGMPNALMEALAAGVPCIAADCPCGGPASLIQDGKNGLLTETGNVKMMAEKMRLLLDDSALRNKIGQNARESAKNYLPESVFCMWKDYVDAVAGYNNR